MIEVYVTASASMWFGIAYTENSIVATSVGSSKDRTFRSLLRSLPSRVHYRVVERGSELAERTIPALQEAHMGKREFRDFTLAEEFFSEPVARVLKAAAAIPVGYVASYGDIARVASTNPRMVGRIMASNPLYPIVPCHRVVGADFSLVGYGGRKSSDALKAKLARLITESRGFKSETNVPISGAVLKVFPVERVITAARKHGITLSGTPQHTLASWQSDQPSQ
jgi:O-6-methylguanine DNA methyltransferase